MGPAELSGAFRTLDLTGVLANAVLGGVIARQEKLDPIGFATLAVLSGLGGGLIRAVLLQHRAAHRRRRRHGHGHEPDPAQPGP